MSLIKEPVLVLPSIQQAQTEELVLGRDLKGQRMHVLDESTSTLTFPLTGPRQENPSLDMTSKASQCTSLIKEPVLVLPSIDWAQTEKLILGHGSQRPVNAHP